VLGAVVVATVLVAPAGRAEGRETVFVNDLTAPGASPLLEDGTASTAVYGTLTGPDRQAAVRVSLAPGDPLVAELAVPDRPPERDLPEGSLPRLVVTDPTGATTERRPDRREPVADPVSGAGLLRVARLELPAEPGVHTLVVTGSAPARFVLGIGTRDVPATITDYTPPPTGAIEAFYGTPPPDEATLGEPTPMARTPAPPPDLDLERLTGTPVADASPGRAAGLPLALAAVAILAVVLVAVLRGRRARSG